MVLPGFPNEHSPLSISVLLFWTLCSGPRCTIIVVIFSSLFGPLVSHNSFSAFETCIFSDFRQFLGFPWSPYISHPSIHPSIQPPLLLLSCHARPNSHRNFVSPTHLHADKSPPLSSPSFVLHVCTVKQISPPFSFSFFSLFSLFSLSLSLPLSLSPSLFSIAPEPFPSDPV